MKKYLDGVLVDLTDDEIEQKNKDISELPSELERELLSLRSIRNSLLQKTDWTASSDLTMSDEMKTYRQELRDATNGLDTVDKVKAYTFPTEVIK
jgi:hypothetical protein|tara:strand:- start:191 stop:475 length:285 start_codon:yes stop_codon:yes gene_type:complete